jgi:hypothetical protein
MFICNLQQVLSHETIKNYQQPKYSRLQQIELEAMHKRTQM